MEVFGMPWYGVFYLGCIIWCCIGFFSWINSGPDYYLGLKELEKERKLQKTIK